MTLIFEMSKPFQLKPGFFKSRAMVRCWWLWFAVAYSPRRIDKLICAHDFDWID